MESKPSGIIAIASIMTTPFSIKQEHATETLTMESKPSGIIRISNIMTSPFSIKEEHVTETLTLESKSSDIVGISSIKTTTTGNTVKKTLSTKRVFWGGGWWFKRTVKLSTQNICTLLETGKTR